MKETNLIYFNENCLVMKLNSIAWWEIRMKTEVICSHDHEWSFKKDSIWFPLLSKFGKLRENVFMKNTWKREFEDMKK